MEIGKELKKEKYFSFNKKDPLFNKIVDFVSMHKNIKSVLDVGCGNCYLASLLKKRFSNIDVYGLDTDDELIRYCKEKKFKVKKASILNIPFKKNSFDLVVAKDIIEHVKDNYKAVEELVRVSNKYVFISAPAPFNQVAWDDFFHVRPYTQETLKHIAEIFNLRILKIGAVKRKFPFQLIAKLWFQPIDEITVYGFYEK